MSKSTLMAATVTEAVRAWILSGSLVRDELYSVAYVAERLDVSRSPAREGLLALADAGLIEFRRNRGFRIVVPTGHQVAEIFAMRILLEPSAAAQAAAGADDARIEQVQALQRRLDELAVHGESGEFAQADQALHTAVLRIAGNERARICVDEMRDLIRTLGPSTAGRSRTLVDIADEHRPFVEAIAHHDPTRARYAMRQHLVTTGRLLIQECADAGDDEAWAAWHRLVSEDD